MKIYPHRHWFFQPRPVQVGTRHKAWDLGFITVDWESSTQTSVDTGGSIST